MAKATSSSCNMRCDYCYYLDKSNLYENAGISYDIKVGDEKKIMSDETLELFIRQYISSQSTRIVRFDWHGGEALMRPRSFYQKTIELQKKYSFGHQIENTIQTNGLLMNDEWAKFFKENNFLVGISLDGDEEQHNQFRHTISKAGSFHYVMRAINILKRHGVDFNILSTINSFNVREPLRYYKFLKAIDCKYIQFTPIVERINISNKQIEAPDIVHLSDKELAKDTKLAPYSITAEEWGDFLIEIFDEWVRNDVGEIFIQLFDVTLANWMGMPSGLCTMSKYCGQIAVIEYNGDIYSCDHYVYKDYLLGNIKDKDLSIMMSSKEQNAFAKSKYTSLTKQCLDCQYLFACYGECPKNRFAYSNDGEFGQNFLCKGYYRFFDYIAEDMDFMKSKLMKGKAPRDIIYRYRKANNK